MTKNESKPCDLDKICTSQESVDEQLGRIRVQMREVCKRLERLENHRHDSTGRASIGLNEFHDRYCL